MIDAETPGLPASLAGAVLDALSEAVLVTDADPDDLRIVYANPAWERLTGYAAAEAVGHSPKSFQGPRTDGAAAAAMWDALAAGRPASSRIVNYRRDGSSFLLHMDISPVRDGNGTTTHYVCVQRDVSDEAELAAERSQLDLVARLQHDIASTELDPKRQRQRVAEVAMTVTGADAGAVEEVDGEDMVYRAAAGTAAPLLGMRLPVAGSISGYCFRQRSSIVVDDVRTDQRPVDRDKAVQAGFISGVLVPLLHNGICYGVLKVFADAPGRFGRAEREMLDLASSTLAVSLANAAAFDRQVERRNILVDAVPTLIAYVDTNWRYVDVNAAYEQRFGVPAAAIRGKRVADMVDAESFARIRPQLAAAFAGQFVSYQTSVTLSTGEVRTLRPEYRPHIDRDGQVQGVYALVHDLTDTMAANADFLTGLGNRRHFTQQGEPLVEAARRYDKPLTALMVDVDHFKAINDRYGHDTGDDVLRDVAATLRDGCRSADVIARWGGEEFVLLLPETGEADAAVLADRLRQAVPEAVAATNEPVTVSAGLAGLAAPDSLDSLLGRADARLYAAKQAGRNRVVAAVDMAKA